MTGKSKVQESYVICSSFKKSVRERRVHQLLKKHMLNFEIFLSKIVYVVENFR